MKRDFPTAPQPSQAATTPGSLESEAAAPVAPKSAEAVCKLAVVSHDYNRAGPSVLPGYADHLHQINRLCDDEGCDTVLYALWTWDNRSAVPKDHDSLFGGLRAVQRIVIESANLSASTDFVEELWVRGSQRPVLMYQRFAASTDPESKMRQFLADLSTRAVADAVVMLCGETNIASLVRSTGQMRDRGFNERLNEMGVRVVLNPVHTCMTTRMIVKRRHYSQDGRTVVSVWNQGRGRGESVLPWMVFHDGKQRTDAVRELARPFKDRPDIRVGVLSLPPAGDN